MDLYLLRHGDAVDRDTSDYARDEERPLTADGRDEARHAAEALRRLGVTLDAILTSPLVRARQTAALVATILPTKHGPIESAALAPGGTSEALLAAIAATGTPTTVLLVGHMPDLGELAGWLVWGDPVSTLPLRTGGLCRITTTDPPTPGTGDLRWLLPPRLLRRLG